MDRSPGPGRSAEDLQLAKEVAAIKADAQLFRITFEVEEFSLRALPFLRMAVQVAAQEAGRRPTASEASELETARSSLLYAAALAGELGMFGNMLAHTEYKKPESVSELIASLSWTHVSLVDLEEKLTERRELAPGLAELREEIGLYLAAHRKQAQEQAA